MFSKRSEELILAAAEALADGQNPFETHFLVTHGVTFEEHFALGEHVAVILQGFLASPRATQNAVIACGVSNHFKEQKQGVKTE